MEKNLVYHYCDLNAFANIMKTKKVWLSDVKKSNDSNEGKYLIRLLVNYIDAISIMEKDIDKEAVEYVRKLILECVDKNDFRMFIPYKYTYEKLMKERARDSEVLDVKEDSILQDIDSEEDKKALKYVERMTRQMKKEQEEIGADLIPGDEYYTDKFEPPLYTLCFSGQSDLLSQWRGYADDGAGVAIGFKTKYLAEWNSWIFDPDSSYQMTADFRKVDYGSKEIYDLLSETMSSLLSLARCILDDKKSDYAMSMIQGNIHTLLCHTVFVKDIAFKEEDEYRLIYNPRIKCNKGEFIIDDSVREKISQEVSDFKLSEMKCRVGKQGITTYYELSFDEIKDRIIGEIILGPRCKMSTADVEYMLSMWGYNRKEENVYDQRSIYIHRSNLSYR